jgi:hypothetical protein
MRHVLTLFLLFAILVSQAQELSLTEVRKLYIDASFEESAAVKLFDLTKNSSIETDYLQFSYNAVSQMLQSKFAINPFVKLKAFNDGKEQLEKVIKQYPQDIELRFLRFCVQDGTPAILDYKLNMKEDSQFIENKISKSSKELQTFITPIFKTLNDGRTSYSGR